MSKRTNETRTSIDNQFIHRPWDQSHSFLYQLPDVVLQRKRDQLMPYAETFNGIVLFADVSGFTEMCQKYSSDVQRGVNQLANALNSYMAPIVEAILKEKGDVYKFAGDAVLGLWPFENPSIEHKREQAKRAISCALYMKKSFCDYMTPIGTILNIKSGIAMGSYSIIFLRGTTSVCSKILDEHGFNLSSAKKNLHFYSEKTRKGNSRKKQTILQTHKSGLNEEMIEHCKDNLVNYYVCYGCAIVSVRNAEHECKSQDIIVDLGTWLLLDSDLEYSHEKFSAEHDEEDVEIPAASSNHVTDIIASAPSNTLFSATNKRLSPPHKNRDTAPIRKILCHYIRLFGRRNDLSIDSHSTENHSVMSIDSIEPTNSNEILNKRHVSHQYSPRNHLLNKWNTPKTPFSELDTTDTKEFLSATLPAKRSHRRLSKRVDLTEEESQNLRPSAFLNYEEYDIFDLSTFVIKSVRDQESLDQLSELRLINICFINIMLTDYRIKHLPLTLQTIIDCCVEQISITNGLLTKVFMFDKGLSLLCAFGMPGYKHPDDAERALKFGFLITQRLEKLNFVARVSTGVSTGQTFCGVLGHPLRCEYTVIGRKVNMAARLMVNYPGIVSCDDETYHKAHLEERYFELLPTVPLKGLTVSTSMRRYKGQDGDENNMSVFVFPMIDREDEWNTILEYLEQVIQHNCTNVHCILLTGSTGVGRSRLLAHVNEELMYDTQNVRRVSYNGSFEHVQLFGYTLKQLFKKLLYTELLDSDALLRVLKSLLPNHEQYLYLLRPYFDKLNIDVNTVAAAILKRKMLEEMIRDLVLNATNPTYEIFNYQPQPTVFIVDDAQYIDKESWQYLHLLGSAPTSLLVIAMRDPTLNDDDLHTRMIAVRDSTTTKHIRLIGLDNRFLSTLACQAMFVQRIPKDLEILITRKSDKGHPQNVVQLLSDLLSNQIIRIETINNDEDFNEGYIDGIQKYLWKRVAQHDPATGNVKILFEFVESQICRICDPDRNKFWTYTTVIENINAHVKIDKLKDFEKRIAKISSLFTKNISRRVIVHAMTNYDIHTNEMVNMHQNQLNNNKHHTSGLNADLLRINTAFSQLYRAQIFECAWLDFEARKNPTIAKLLQEKNLTPICCCPENTTKQIENCRMYTFKDPTLKEATLATIIDQFQHDYSSKMALFIQSRNHLCKSCGGDSDSLIFLTPVQSMKLGMSILDTFHERKLKQLNQRLQLMISNHFSNEQNNRRSNNEDIQTDEEPLTHNDDSIGENRFVQNFYQNVHQRELNDQGKYFQELRTKIKQVNTLGKHTVPLTLFNPMAVGARKDTIEGETYANIPFRLQENSVTQPDSPLTMIDSSRFSLDPNNIFYKEFQRVSSKNNHCHQKNPTETCNAFVERYLQQQTKHRWSTNRFRLFPRRSFKFRRKKPSRQIKLDNQSAHLNNNHMHAVDAPEMNIEDVLNRQWMRTFEQKKVPSKLERKGYLSSSANQTIGHTQYLPDRSRIPSSNNAVDDTKQFIHVQERTKDSRETNQQSRSLPNASESTPRHSVYDKDKRLLTKTVVIGAEHRARQSYQTNVLSSPDEEKSPRRSFPPAESSSINERLFMNFTEACPLFLLKEGIDHRFEFLDFAPDLYIRQTFRSISSDEFYAETSETENIKSIPNDHHHHHHPRTEIEYNQRHCRCNYLLVEVYRLLIRFWEQSSNIEKVLYYSLELARVELARTNYYESKTILQNMLQRLEKEGAYLNLPTFFQPQLYDLLSESVYRMRQNDQAFLYVVYGLKLLNVQLIDFRSRDSSKLKNQCKQLRHTLLRTLIRPMINKKFSDEELIQRYFTGKLLFRAGQCARRHGQLFFAYFCLLNSTLSLIQCHFLLNSYEHCQALTLLAELSHDLKRIEDCDLFIQAIIKYTQPIHVGYETIAIKSNWLSMTWNLYRARIDRALDDSYKIKDLLNRIGAYKSLMSVATYSLQAALIGRREEVIRDLIDIIDNECSRPLKYEHRLWSFILTLEAFVELNIKYDESLLNEVVRAIDYVLDHLERKTSTPGDIQKFLTLVFYAQATLVECYTKIVRLDQANEHYMRAIKFGMSLKEWTFRVCNGMLKLAFYEVYECTKWLLEARLAIIPKEVEERLIISHLYDISKHFKLLRPRCLMCLALKLLIIGNHRSAKTQFANAIRLATDLDLDHERKHIETTRKQIFKVVSRRNPMSTVRRRAKRTKN